ncbi:hypothetical protein DFP72DRAFT_1047706 [Ephemerocybe angulata]|uniref:Uncharacterized protein n=1 Tax=Ephemerocybe angulata TaxID=980116 RepID=A0A8H6HRT2_9AGAR|nr:hypothetical protein DFP72DRAFT_1047706 [Tulosesus angulatus]
MTTELAALPAESMVTRLPTQSHQGRFKVILRPNPRLVTCHVASFSTQPLAFPVCPPTLSHDADANRNTFLHFISRVTEPDTRHTTANAHPDLFPGRPEIEFSNPNYHGRIRDTQDSFAGPPKIDFSKPCRRIDPLFRGSRKIQFTYSHAVSVLRVWMEIVPVSGTRLDTALAHNSRTRSVFRTSKNRIFNSFTTPSSEPKARPPSRGSRKIRFYPHAVSCFGSVVTRVTSDSRRWRGRKLAVLRAWLGFVPGSRPRSLTPRSDFRKSENQDFDTQALRVPDGAYTTCDSLMSKLECHNGSVKAQKPHPLASVAMSGGAARVSAPHLRRELVKPGLRPSAEYSRTYMTRVAGITPAQAMSEAQ